MQKRITLMLTIMEGVFTKTRNFNAEHIYSIEHIDFSYFDELVLVNVDKNLSKEYLDFIEKVTTKLSIPLVVSGSIKSIEDAKQFFKLGADRIILNNALWNNPSVLKEISDSYGKQAVIASFDFIECKNGVTSFDWRTKQKRKSLVPDNIKELIPYIGEILLQDVSRDGKVLGANINEINRIINELSFNIPFHIGSCGLVSWPQYAELLSQSKVDAVAVNNIHHMSPKANKSLRDWCFSENLNIRTPWKSVKNA